MVTFHALRVIVIAGELLEGGGLDALSAAVAHHLGRSAAMRSVSSDRSISIKEKKENGEGHETHLGA